MIVGSSYVCCYMWHYVYLILSFFVCEMINFLFSLWCTYSPYVGLFLLEYLQAFHIFQNVDIVLQYDGLPNCSLQQSGFSRSPASSHLCRDTSGMFQQIPLLPSEVYMHIIISHFILNYPINVYNAKHDTDITCLSSLWSLLEVPFQQCSKQNKENHRFFF